ncbi:MAG: glycerate kinase [Bacteroidales bacterium]
MNILVAPDSFKNSLSALEVARSVRRGLLQEMPDAEIRLLPVADGGEGTVDSLIDATGGKAFIKEVSGPLGRPVKARFGILGDGKTAIIEMAAASGLELLTDEERNPWITTTYGTGQLIIAALDENCRKIIIGVGGSATNDGGVGMGQALGINFLKKDGKSIGSGGGELADIHHIDESGIDQRIGNVEIQVACDVTNVLCGSGGASYIYGPQKGADPGMVKKLDDHLAHLGRLIREKYFVDVTNVPGAGAAGGLAAGLMAFAGAELKPGFQIVREVTRLDEQVKWADLVITGEGKIDSQTQYGKTPMGVAGVAGHHGKPVIAIAGTLGEGYEELYELGFGSILSILDKPLPLREALITAPRLIERCARTAIRLYRMK